MNFKTLLTVLILTFQLLACSGLETRVVEDINEMKKGPKNVPTRNITNFSSALRCMDNLMYTHGIEKFSVLAEDIKDKTKRVNAGTRDMLITAVSDMSKRSRAINMIVFGNDSGNLISYLSQAGKQNAYNEVPKYDIRGSISQFDNNVVSQNLNAGIGIPEAGFGFSTSAAGSILGLDMSMVDTSDMSLVSGVTSRNSIIILNSGSGGDADGTIKKAGINFGINFAKSEGQTQALRNLLELATVELFGKLLKLPYWSCLGIDPEHESIALEIDDWYFSLKTNNELVAYAQNQLIKRGFYEGLIDGQVSPQYEKAVALYKISLSMPSDNANVDKILFEKMLNTPLPKEAPTRIAKRTQTVSPESSESQPEVAVIAETTTEPETNTLQNTTTENNNEKSSQNQNIPTDPNAVMISASNSMNQFSPGQQLNLVIRTNRDAHIYCFFQDDNNIIQRVFPNRFIKQSFVRAGEEINLPGAMPFEVTASDKGKTESLQCFSTTREVLSDLSTSISVLDFVDLDVDNFAQIKENFKLIAGASLGEGLYNIRLQ